MRAKFQMLPATGSTGTTISPMSSDELLLDLASRRRFTFLANRS